jgi:Ca2+-binding RTX toxin-like protein
LTITATALVLMVGTVAVAKTLACGGGKCFGTNTPDTMCGRSKRDVMYGRMGGDLMRGNGGRDYINADGGRDRALGGRGDDALNGGSGNDRIDAADGMFDKIDCGSGTKDVLIFDARLDSFRGCEIWDGR